MMTLSGIMRADLSLNMANMRFSHLSRINGVSCRNNLIASIDENGMVISRAYHNQKM